MAGHPHINVITYLFELWLQAENHVDLQDSRSALADLVLLGLSRHVAVLGLRIRLNFNVD